MKKPVALIIMDGVGLAKASIRNAVSLANTPNLNEYIKKYPKIQLRTDGNNVGLPKGQMGNSEVGHLNIGAGRVILQSLSRIDQAIEDDKLKDMKNLLEAINYAKTNNSTLHILGLASDGGVHSHIDHIITLNKIALEHKVKVVVHAFLDGRDVGPKTSLTYLNQLEQAGITIASISGRYYAMDRDKRWERAQLSYDALTSKNAPKFDDIKTFIEQSYKKEVYDEFVLPAYNEKVATFIQDKDAVVFANFRPDRARQISHMLLKDSNLYDYKPELILNDLHLVTMMEYAGIDAPVIFEPLVFKNLLGEVLAAKGMSQIRAAETEKYPHVTFFLDGGKEVDFENELKILVPSPKIATYDLQPEMSAPELTDKIVEKIADFDAAIINFANGDMVGHSGSIPATIKAVETVDASIGRIYQEVVEKAGGILMICADHGNADEMQDEEGNPITKHSTNPVPLIITSNDVSFKDDFRTGDQIGKLADLAPTMLKLLKIEIPKEMTGNILIK